MMDKVFKALELWHQAIKCPKLDVNGWGRREVRHFSVVPRGIARVPVPLAFKQARKTQFEKVSLTLSCVMAPGAIV